MLEGKYCQIINKITKKVIASGKIINHKDIPVKCITFDNRYYFNTCKHLFYKFIYCDYCDEIPFDYIKHKRIIKKWSSSPLFKYSLVFREYDITELDKEIENLVYALNNAGFRTIGSCCGHGINVAWVDIEFCNFNQIKSLINILNIKDFNTKFCLSTSDSLVNDKQNVIDLRLKSVKIGKEAYRDIKEFAKYLNVMN